VIEIDWFLKAPRVWCITKMDFFSHAINLRLKEANFSEISVPADSFCLSPQAPLYPPLQWSFKATATQENEECVASGKSVPGLWEQAAISRQACETFLCRLSRLDRGMEGREAGGSELWAPFVWPSLTPPHKRKHCSLCGLLSANRQAACQPGRRRV